MNLQFVILQQLQQQGNPLINIVFGLVILVSIILFVRIRYRLSNKKINVCPRCNNSIEIEAKFCENCGCKIK